jgi:putative hydrolase of the HAD superfamily
MSKKAIILDMDNTIYPVHSIGFKLFKVLFDLIEESGDHANIEEIKAALMKRPFQMVASEYGFSNKLKGDCLALLQELTVEEAMQPFEDYEEIRKITLPKYLVTTGFPKLQHSKVKQLGIQADFAGIFIVDLNMPGASKKAVFQQIMQENNFVPADLIVVGDDINSEIKAGQELGIDAVLYAPENTPAATTTLHVISHFRELQQYL